MVRPTSSAITMQIVLQLTVTARKSGRAIAILQWLAIASLPALATFGAANADASDKSYWYRNLKPACSASAPMMSLMTGSGLFSKQLTLEGQYFVVNGSDWSSRVDKPFVYEDVLLDASRATSLSRALFSMGAASDVPLLAQDLATLATVPLPTTVGLVSGFLFGALYAASGAQATSLKELSHFIVVGGHIQQVLAYRISKDGKPTLTRAYSYVVLLGSESRRFLLASCTYAVMIRDEAFAGKCDANPDAQGLPAFCRERAEHDGWSGRCGGQRLDIDGTYAYCTNDQKPLCDPESFCTCDFDSACSNACKATNSCNGHGN
jgi:hypothetical protein